MEMNKDFKLKRFHKFGILIDKTRILRPNLDWDINFEPFYIIYAKKNWYLLLCFVHIPLRICTINAAHAFIVTNDNGLRITIDKT